MYQYEWNLLGIGETRDEEAIRQAYREKLKTCHPEENPDGWRDLHNAYRRALDFAAGRERIPGTDPPPWFRRKPPERSPSTDPDEAAAFAAEFQQAMALDTPSGADAHEALGRAMRRRGRITLARAGEILSALGSLPLRDGSAENSALLERTLKALRPERMTREGCRALADGLWDLAAGLPVGTEREALEKHAALCSEACDAQTRLWESDLADARFAWICAIPGTLFGGALVFAGIFYATQKRRGLRLPAERRQKDPARRKCALLFTAALVMMLVSGMFFGAGMADGYNKPTELVTTEETPVFDAARESVYVSLTVAEPPVSLGMSVPIVPTDDRLYFFDCVTPEGSHALLSLTQRDMEKAPLLERCPFTVYGYTGVLPNTGHFLSEGDDFALLMKDPAALLDVSLRNYAAVKARAEGYGPYSVVSFRGTTDTPVTHRETVYPATFFFFYICKALLSGSSMQVLLRILRKWIH